jgi:hypothetical protein
MLLPIHVAAAGLAIVLGAVALLVKKGATVHRRSGMLFVYAMLVMSTSAATLGLRNSPTDGNVTGALMTAYFVGTGLTTVRPASQWTRRIKADALTFAARTRARPARGRRHGCQQPSRFSRRRSVSHDRRGVVRLATVLLLAATDALPTAPETPRAIFLASRPGKFDSQA